MVAITILAIGLLGLAALMAQLTSTTGQSRYMGTEVMLASEKQPMKAHKNQQLLAMPCSPDSLMEP